MPNKQTNKKKIITLNTNMSHIRSLELQAQESFNKVLDTIQHHISNLLQQKGTQDEEAGENTTATSKRRSSEKFFLQNTPAPMNPTEFSKESVMFVRYCAEIRNVKIFDFGKVAAPPAPALGDLVDEDDDDARQQTLQNNNNSETNNNIKALWYAFCIEYNSQLLLPSADDDDDNNGEIQDQHRQQQQKHQRRIPRSWFQTRDVKDFHDEYFIQTIRSGATQWPSNKHKNHLLDEAIHGAENYYRAAEFEREQEIYRQMMMTVGEGAEEAEQNIENDNDNNESCATYKADQQQQQQYHHRQQQHLSGNDETTGYDWNICGMTKQEEEIGNHLVQHSARLSKSRLDDFITLPKVYHSRNQQQQ